MYAYKNQTIDMKERNIRKLQQKSTSLHTFLGVVGANMEKLLHLSYNFATVHV